MPGMRNPLIAGIWGNILEWFDSSLYVYLTPVLAELFFPSENKILSTIIAFSVFAGGFFMRPIGAYVIGQWGDRFGRKKVLIASISMMTVPTTLIGFLPTYNNVGLSASFALILLRMIQGFAVSGELNATATFLIEHAPKKQKAFYGSVAMSSAFFGVILASGCITLLTTILDIEQLHAWGWRLPFILSFILGVIGLVIRLGTTETQTFVDLVDKDKKPMKNVWRYHKAKVLHIILVTAIMGVGNYMLVGYFPTLISQSVLGLKWSYIINFASLVLLTLSIPFCGLLGDKFSINGLLRLGIGGFIVLGLPIFHLLNSGQLVLVFIGQLLFTICLLPVAALLPYLTVMVFPTACRNSASTFGYNCGQAFFGGTVPVISITLVKVTAWPAAPALYLILIAIIALWALNALNNASLERLD